MQLDGVIQTKNLVHAWMDVRTGLDGHKEEAAKSKSGETQPLI